MRPTNINEYIDKYPKEVKVKLKALRLLTKKLAPKAIETISYGMPTFKLNNKNLVHFAAFKNHIGFYPLPSGVNEFKKLTKRYKTSKGAVQFPLDQEIPLDLVSEIIKFRILEITNK